MTRRGDNYIAASVFCKGGKKMNKIKTERFATVRKASEYLKKENFGGIYFTDK